MFKRQIVEENTNDTRSLLPCSLSLPRCLTSVCIVPDVSYEIMCRFVVCLFQWTQQKLRWGFFFCVLCFSLFWTSSRMMVNERLKIPAGQEMVKSFVFCLESHQRFILSPTHSWTPESWDISSLLILKAQSFKGKWKKSTSSRRPIVFFILFYFSWVGGKYYLLNKKRNKDSLLFCLLDDCVVMCHIW